MTDFLKYLGYIITAPALSTFDIVGILFISTLGGWYWLLLFPLVIASVALAQVFRQ